MGTKTQASCFDIIRTEAEMMTEDKKVVEVHVCMYLIHNKY